MSVVEEFMSMLGRTLRDNFYTLIDARHWYWGELVRCKDDAAEQWGQSQKRMMKPAMAFISALLLAMRAKKKGLKDGAAINGSRSSSMNPYARTLNFECPHAV